MSDTSYRPRTFSLRDYEDAPAVVAWGLVLPDGSAVAVGWPDPSIAVCASAEGAAFVFDADLVWSTPEM